MNFFLVIGADAVAEIPKGKSLKNPQHGEDPCGAAAGNNPRVAGFRSPIGWDMRRALVFLRIENKWGGETSRPVRFAWKAFWIYRKKKT